MAARARRISLSMSLPQMRAVPEVLITRPARMLISVDLPAPFGPSSPKIEPRGTARSTSLSAFFGGAEPDAL